MITPEKRLTYAAGYLQLDLYKEAREELAALPPEAALTPAALTLKIEISMALAEWDEVIELAPRLIHHDPSTERPWVAWAYALRELQRHTEAQEILLTGRRLIRHPSTLVDYNLACYACLLGELEEARSLLEDVFARDQSWREIARNDPDLAPLHLPPV